MIIMMPLEQALHSIMQEALKAMELDRAAG